MKRTIILIAAIALFASCQPSAQSVNAPAEMLAMPASQPDSVTLCHKVAVRGAAVYQTLTFAATDTIHIQQHLAHGDQPGTCTSNGH